MAPALPSRRLGADGPEVTRLGLGLAALGRPGYLTLGRDADLGGDRSPASLERRTHAVLDAAVAAGVSHVDAARSYGRAEAFLASWLRERDVAPGTLTISSKWGYAYTADWRVDADTHEVKDLSAATLRRQLAETRALLGAHLTLYQIHSATLESGVLEDAAVREELEALRATGVAVGLSVTGPGQAATIRRAVETGRFTSVQATWNLLEPSAGEALAAAHAAGVGVIVKEGVANGRLTAHGDVPALHDVATELGATPDAVALAAVLAQPWADGVLSGAVTVDQLHANLAALAVAWDDEVAGALAGLAEPPDAYWGARSARTWS